MILHNHMRINRDLKTLVYLYILIKPEVTADVLFSVWPFNHVFRDYNRPTIEILESWYEEIYSELEELGIKIDRKN